MTGVQTCALPICGSTLCELDGTGKGGAPHNVTESLIRSMYGYYRKVMEV